ncbi:MAG: type II secretion system protein GspE, partial [Myxococcales bacterium]|nr:type II secretion system protein GspE [Myxococcales bacterium]
GRVALYEVMPLTDRLKEMVLEGASTAELKMQMIAEGISSLRMGGIKKSLEGVTTPDEVLRVTTADYK